MNLEHALTQFAAYQRAQNLAENTIRNREYFIRTLAHTCDPLTATVFELRGYMGRPGIAPASRRTARNALRAFYNFLQEDGHRTDNPALKLPTVKVPKPEPRPFTEQQILDMLNSGAYKKTRAMILLGYYQGFRVSSIAAVHGRDIDHTTNTIRTVGKGNKLRVLPMHPLVAEVAKTMPVDGYWFPARGGREGHMLPRSVSDQITDAKRRAGITDPTLTAHSLRHSFGTHLVGNGVDIRVVQELMMHESLSSTQIYTGVPDRLKQAGVAALAVLPVPGRSGRRKAA